MRLIDADALEYTRVRIFHGLNEDGTPIVGGWSAVLTSVAIKDAPTVDAVPINGDFGLMMTCAVRYACGRRTYMPSIVIDYITPLILHLDDATLAIINKDLDEAARTGGYGDPQIDEPRWKAFHALIQQERLLRAGHHCKERGDSDV